MLLELAPNPKNKTKRHGLSRTALSAKTQSPCRWFPLRTGIWFWWFLLGLLLSSGCAERQGEIEIRGETMGTTYVVKVLDLPIGSRGSLAQEIAHRLEWINAIFSTYDANSELSRLNRADFETWHGISAELLEVLAVAKSVFEASGGALDVTIGPLVNIWGFGPIVGSSPPIADAEIQQWQRQIGSDNFELQVSPPAFKKRITPLPLDLSALAKGYAVDQVAQILSARGSQQFMVEIGGEVSARGANVHGEPWQIGIEKPEAGVRQVGWILGLQDQAMASSGDYRNFFERDGKRFSHLLDPRTGRPIEYRMLNVTVVHQSAMLADAWATAFAVLGPEAGLPLAESLGLAVQFVSGDIVTRSKGFEKLPLEEL